MRHRISAGAIIEDGHQRVLLVRHLRPDRYDFWVSPGGGAEATEQLEETASREVLEETGLRVRIGPLVYIEELYNRESRQCKFWFLGERLGGRLGINEAGSSTEHIVDVRWLSRSEMDGKIVYPSALLARYWEDKVRGFGPPVYLGLRPLESW